jgi:hypothetical protein
VVSGTFLAVISSDFICAPFLTWSPLLSCEEGLLEGRHCRATCTCSLGCWHLERTLPGVHGSGPMALSSDNSFMECVTCHCSGWPCLFSVVGLGFGPCDSVLDCCEVLALGAVPALAFMSIPRGAAPP